MVSVNEPRCGLHSRSRLREIFFFCPDPGLFVKSAKQNETFGPEYLCHAQVREMLGQSYLSLTLRQLI